MKLSRSQTHVAHALGQLDGRRIPGGCDACDAYQTVEPIRAGVWHLAIHHEDKCPVLAAHESRTP